MPPTRSRNRPTSDTVTGAYHPHPRGFGFLDLDQPAGRGEHNSVFVPPPAARHLLDGDEVTCRFSEDDRGLTLEKIVHVTRRRFQAAGTLRRTGNSPVLHLHPTCGTGQLRPDTAARAELETVADGVLLAVAVDPDPDLEAFTGILADAAPDTPAAAQLLATTAAYGIDHSHRYDGADRAVLRRAAAHLTVGATAPTRRNSRRRGTAVPGAALERRDLTDVPTVTIDGPTTKDLDDAISATINPDSDTIRIQVHIADVAAHVPAGSDLDRRARTLATSVYLATHTAPMLPTHLSEDRCSLTAGQERDTLTVTFDIDTSGQTTPADLQVTRIRSDAQLTYQRVQAHLDGAQQLPARHAALIDVAAEAARRLARHRERRDTVEELFTAPQVAITVDGTRTSVQDAGGYPDAEQLIERLMVAANETVATWLAGQRRPSLYRVHAGVDDDRRGLLDAAAELAGVEKPVKGAADIHQLLGHTSGPVAAMAEAAAISSLGRAEYTSDPEHHFGLDAQPYTHFTSPIRRYADLAVHRAVRAALAGEEPPDTAEDLATIATWVTLRSGQAARTEALERDLLWGQHLATELAKGRRSTAKVVVTRLTPAGLQVRDRQRGIGGFITAAATGVVGKLAVDSSGLAAERGRWKLGQQLDVELASVDDTGRLQFRPTSADRAA